MSFDHTTVLLHETVDGCVTKPDGVYIDGTFGRGGHSRLLLSKLNQNGRLIGIDKDPLAIAEGERLATDDARFSIYQGSFSELGAALNRFGLTRADGILLDLGVSSPQLDDAERGFSFLRDGPLDMRMNPDAGLSAAEWLASVSDDEMIYAFKTYGEERFAKRMVGAIRKRQETQPFTRTLDFAEVIKHANPAWEKHKHPATRVFQAIRIAVNNELGDLEAALNASLDVLNDGGRLSVISFHSLEDRLVKRFIRDQERGKPVPKHLPIPDDQLGRTLKRVGKAIKPSAAEIEHNVRSRSAVLRIAQRLARNEGAL